MKDWTKVFASSQLATAAMVVNLLDENHVPAKLLDRKDSAYVFLGEAEIYVPTEFVEVANQVIKTIELDTLNP
jgi:hypothetical protein